MLCVLVTLNAWSIRDRSPSRGLGDVYKRQPRNLYSSVICVDIHVIEFQKRGLPHAHILLTLASEDRPTCTEDIDRIICAELPDEDTDLLTFETVTRHMIHGLCGTDISYTPCMDGDTCTKHYLKSFCGKTIIEENGFVKYRRWDNGRSVTIRGKRTDNRWVIPYNRDLCVNMMHILMLSSVHKRRSLSTFTNTCIRELTELP